LLGHQSDGKFDLKKGAATMKVDDAVGVPERKWFVAQVGQNAEKSSRDHLIRLGYDAFVASKDEIRSWSNGKQKHVEVVIISTWVFVHVTEEERRQIVNLPFIKYFLTDKAGRANDFGVHPVAVIPQREMEKLQFMLYQNDQPVTFLSRPLKAGDNVRVIRGSLRGLEAQVTRYRDGDTYLVVNVGMLGCAMVRIALSDVEPL
jgi:transcription antitermination factor NusG